MSSLNSLIQSLPIVSLSPCNIYMEELEFQPVEGAKYAEMESLCRSLVQDFVDDNPSGKIEYGFVLGII
jgi:hypothetical protein